MDADLERPCTRPLTEYPPPFVHAYAMAYWKGAVYMSVRSQPQASELSLSLCVNVGLACTVKGGLHSELCVARRLSPNLDLLGRMTLLFIL